jgi:hypothetical protein
VYDKVNTCVKASDICFVDIKATSGSGTQSSPYKTIGACLATSKGYISVSSGTYKEHLGFSGKKVQVVAAYDTKSAYAGNLPTVNVDGSSQTQVVLVGSASDVYLQGIYVMPGKVMNELVRINGKSTAAFDRCVIAVPVASSYSANMGVDVAASSKLVMDDCSVAGVLAHGIKSTDSDVTLKKVGVEYCGKIGILTTISTGGKMSKLDFSELLVDSNKSEGIKITGGGGWLDRIAVINNGAVGTEFHYPGLNLIDSNGIYISNLLAVYNGYGVKYDDSVNCPGPICPVSRLINATIAFSKRVEMTCPSSSTSTSKLYITNSIIWDSSSSFPIVSGSGCNISYTDVAGGYTGSNNITFNPTFVNPSTSKMDFHLQKTSKCIDSGDTSASLPKTDLDGKARVYNSVVDMGAYEYQ